MNVSTGRASSWSRLNVSCTNGPNVVKNQRRKLQRSGHPTCNSLVLIVVRQRIYENATSLPRHGTSFARRRFELHLKQASGRRKRPYMAMFDCSNYSGNIGSYPAFRMISGRYQQYRANRAVTFDPVATIHR